MKIVKYIKDNYVLIAAFLALLSGLTLNKGATAKANKLALDTNQLIDSVVTQTATTTINKTSENIRNSTQILKEETDYAILKITNATSELSRNLSLVNQASRNLENKLQNQEILVKCKFTFEPQSTTNGEVDYDLLKKMDLLLTENNYYELKLYSSNRISEFDSDNNHFQRFSEELDSDLFNQTFVNGFFYEDVNIHYMGESVASLKINYKLNLIRTDFLLDDFKKGDEVMFRITKRFNRTPRLTKEQIDKGWTLSNFASFRHRKGNDPLSKLNLTIRLKNGTQLECETYKAETLNGEGFRGVEFYYKVVKVRKNQVK